MFSAANESGHNTRTNLTNLKKQVPFPLAATNRNFKNSIPSSHGVDANFEVKFSNCESSQLSCVYFLCFCMVCRFYCFCYNVVNVNSTLQFE